MAAGTAVLAFSGPLLDYHPCEDAETICIHPAYFTGVLTTIPLLLAIYWHQRAGECEDDRRAWAAWQQEQPSVAPSR